MKCLRLDFLRGNSSFFGAFTIRNEIGYVGEGSCGDLLKITHFNLISFLRKLFNIFHYQQLCCPGERCFMPLKSMMILF